jgi:hypothetical protein
MKWCSRVCFLAFLTLFAACGLEGNDEAPLLIFSTTYDFNEGEHGWIHGFADYPADPNDSALFELKYVYTDLPADTKLVKKSIMLSGKNLSEDLFMYLKKPVTGLKPDTEYTITFSIELASDLNADLAGGIGSAQSVYLKAGATHFEPKSIIEAGYYVMNLDKGNQSSVGEDMTSLGDIVTPENSTGYVLITRNNTMANSRYVSKSNSNGELWLIIGTDSGFKGTNAFYYTQVNVVFSAS